LYLAFLELVDYYADLNTLSERVDEEDEESIFIENMTVEELKEENELMEAYDDVLDAVDKSEYSFGLPFFLETAFMGQFKLEPTMDEEFVVQDGVRYFEFETYLYLYKQYCFWNQVDFRNQQKFKMEVTENNKNLVVLKKKLEENYFLIWYLTNGWDPVKVLYCMYILILAEVRDYKVVLMFLEKRKKDLLLLDFVIFRRSILKQMGNDLGLVGNFYQKMVSMDKRINYFDKVMFNRFPVHGVGKKLKFYD